MNRETFENELDALIKQKDQVAEDLRKNILHSTPTLDKLLLMIELENKATMVLGARIAWLEAENLALRVMNEWGLKDNG